MAKGHNKQKNTKDEEVMDGLGVSFEDAMKVFAQPVNKPKSPLVIEVLKALSEKPLVLTPFPFKTSKTRKPESAPNND